MIKDEPLDTRPGPAFELIDVVRFVKGRALSVGPAPDHEHLLSPRVEGTAQLIVRFMNALGQYRFIDQVHGPAKPLEASTPALVRVHGHDVRVFLTERKLLAPVSVGPVTKR